MRTEQIITIRIEDIPAALRKIRAATLRDLAELWYSDNGPHDQPPLSMASWLRAEADRVESEEAEESR